MQTTRKRTIWRILILSSLAIGLFLMAPWIRYYHHIQTIEAEGGTVTFCDVDAWPADIVAELPQGADWLNRLAGDVAEVTWPDKTLSPEQIKKLAFATHELRPYDVIAISGISISAETFETLMADVGPYWLSLWDCDLQPGCEKSLLNAQHLEVLNLCGSRFPSSFVHSCSKLPTLSHLYLCECQLTGNDIESLSASQSLTYLSVGDTTITSPLPQKWPPKLKYLVISGCTYESDLARNPPKVDLLFVSDKVKKEFADVETPELKVFNSDPHADLYE